LPHAAPAELRAKVFACSRSLRSRRGTRGGRCSFKVASRASRTPIAKLACGAAPAIALGNVNAAVALATETRATARRARVGAVGMTALVRLWVVAREPDTSEPMPWSARAHGRNDQKRVPRA
jgi:hypothetical protein